MTRIGNAQFWVHDQDEALDFYTRVLGWEVRADVTMEAWSFRWLCVGPVGQNDVGLVLMPVPGPPMLDAGDSAQLAQLVAKGPAGRCSSRPTTARPATTSVRTWGHLQRPPDPSSLRHRYVIPGSVRQQHPAHSGSRV
jgi:catechol 2,3-dioxygenase-like lactoylglutathione lyase family enzyme